MSAGTINLEIEKRAKFYQALDIELDDGTPVSLVGRKVECKIKESFETEEVLFNLTEDNGGILVINDALGKIALVIPANQTNIVPDYGVYDIVAVVPSDLTEKERLLEGKIRFTEGAT